jgi:hypothetical protein
VSNDVRGRVRLVDRMRGRTEAVRTRAPAIVGVMVQVPAATEPLQLAAPSLTVTSPVGVPLPGGDTITV